MIRSFIAFDLENKESLQNIQNFQDRLKQNQSRLKPIKPENIHITVKFLGDIKESIIPQIYQILEKEINEKILRKEEYTYKIKHVGNFRNYGIIWVGLEGNIELMQSIKDTVEEKLNDRLNIKKDNRRNFKPHITIARLKKKRRDYSTFESFKNIFKENRNKEFGEFNIHKIVLKKSDLTPKGPIYSTYNGEEFI
ncbi:MAG: RNA 2',3'-cyclic phosphodiesterase [Promethearchaeota archaeon]|nr:MAG: RNA 2',3'-cyclic phosphodiesterase [Candidatus Lokiarchaeota archaeon]